MTRVPAVIPRTLESRRLDSVLRGKKEPDSCFRRKDDAQLPQQARTPGNYDKLSSREVKRRSTLSARSSYRI